MHDCYTVAKQQRVCTWMPLTSASESLVTMATVNWNTPVAQEPPGHGPIQSRERTCTRVNRIHRLEMCGTCTKSKRGGGGTEVPKQLIARRSVNPTGRLLIHCLSPGWLAPLPSLSRLARSAPNTNLTQCSLFSQRIQTSAQTQTQPATFHSAPSIIVTSSVLTKRWCARARVVCASSIPGPIGTWFSEKPMPTRSSSDACKEPHRPPMLSTTSGSSQVSCQEMRASVLSRATATLTCCAAASLEILARVQLAAPVPGCHEASIDSYLVAQETCFVAGVPCGPVRRAGVAQ